MYSTVKKVSFRSPVLCTVKYLLMVLVLGYVVGYQFAYQGIHLQGYSVEGSLDYRLRPATAPCSDPSKWRPSCGRLRYRFSDLPYCRASQQPAPLNLKRACHANKLQGVKQWPTILYIPTWVEEWKRPFDDAEVDKVLSQPGNRTRLWQEPEATLASELFISNAEQSMFELEHRLQLPKGRNITGMDMKGYFLPANSRNRAPVDMKVYREEDFRQTRWKPTAVQKRPLVLQPSRVHLANSLVPRVVRDDFDALIKISVAGILRLAGIELDQAATGSETWRSCGVKVILDIEYKNTESWPGLHVTPWSEPAPWFTWRVKHEVATCPSAFKYHGGGAFTRTRGIRLEIIQTGTLKAWSPFRAIVGLTTVLTLLGTAVRGLEMYLENCTDWYKDMKYERKGNAAAVQDDPDPEDPEDKKTERTGAEKDDSDSEGDKPSSSRH